MKKKIICIGIIGLFLLTFINQVCALDNKEIKSLNNDINFSLDSDAVIYSPEPPVKGEIVTFTVTVTFEGCSGRENVLIQLYSNGNEVQESHMYASPLDPTKEIYYQWPDSDSNYDIEIKADPDNIYDETNEDDNCWSESISTPKPRSDTNPLIDLLKNMIENFNWPFPMIRVLLSAIEK